MGTRSLALVCHDYDVPSLPDDVNVEGRTICGVLAAHRFLSLGAGRPRSAFRPDPRGRVFRRRNGARQDRPAGAARNARQGMNDYTLWFADDAEMRGDYLRLRRPVSAVERFDRASLCFHRCMRSMSRSCGVSGTFRGPDVLNAMKGHVLEEAKLTGLYSSESTGVRPDMTSSPVVAGPAHAGLFVCRACHESILHGV